MNESILATVKKMLGLNSDYQYFDQDIIIHINSVFGILCQLGIGPESGFSISDSSTKWSDYITKESNLEMVKSYIYFKVRLMFDPPLTSSVTESINNSISEFEFRLCYQAEIDKIKGGNE